MSQMPHSALELTRAEAADAETTPSSVVSRPRLDSAGTRYKKVAYGTMWSAASKVASMIASLLSTPFMTRYLGAELYGIWALSNNIASYLRVTSMGTGSASTTFAAEAYARKDEAAECAVIWTSFFFAVLPATIGIVAVMLAAGPLVREVFGIPEDLQRLAAMGVRLTALAFGAELIERVFNTPQVVRLRIDLYEKLNILFVLAHHCLILMVVFLDGNLLVLIGAVTACAALRALAIGFASRSLLPGLLRPRFDVTLIRPLFRFGRGVTISFLIGIVLTNIDYLFLARYSSVRDVAYYSIAMKLALFLSVIPNALRLPLLPSFSALRVENENGSIERFYSQAMRTILLYVIPSSILICICGGTFLRIWAGPEFAEHSIIPLYILVVGITCENMGIVSNSLLTAAGRTGIIARCHIIQVVPYVICSVFLTIRFGATGAAIATSLRMLSETILYFAATRDQAGLRLRVLTGDWRIYGIALLIFVGAVPAAICLGINPIVRMMIAAAGCIIFTAGVWTIILSPGERKSLLQILRLSSGK